MPDTTNDIDALKTRSRKIEMSQSTFSALLQNISLCCAAEQRVAELESEATVSAKRVSDLIAERDALQQRVEELGASVSMLARQLDAQQPADRDLRQRNDAMVRWMDQVTAMLCHSLSYSHDANQELVNRYGAAIAAMRREGEA